MSLAARIAKRWSAAQSFAHQLTAAFRRIAAMPNAPSTAESIMSAHSERVGMPAPTVRLALAAPMLLPLDVCNAEIGIVLT